MDAMQTHAQIKHGEQLIKQLNRDAIGFMVGEALRLRCDASFIVNIVRKHYAPRISGNCAADIAAYLESITRDYEDDLDVCDALGVELDMCEYAAAVIDRLAA